MARRALWSCVLLSFALTGVLHAETALAPRAPAIKPTRAIVTSAHITDRIAVKFRDDSKLRLRAGVLHDEGTVELTALTPTLAGPLAGSQWRRFHPDVSEQKLDECRDKAEQSLGKKIANLNTQFELVLPVGVDPAAAIDMLNALDIVEIAEPMPKPVAPPLPPNFFNSQSYLSFSPTGIGASSAWALLNATGAGVRIVDVEYSFNTSHQDLPPVTILGPTWVDPFNDPNHGTAVIGELAARNNGWGTTGAAYDSTIYFSAANTALGYNVGSAISRTFGTLSPGDVILIEQQMVGPNYTGQPAGTQTGLIPVEWYRPWYDTIVTAVGLGIHVVMAAGNGEQNLDDPIYSTGNNGHWPFLAHNDSGAIIVGAGSAPPSSPARARLWFSNWGSTVDLQGWGERVVTTGYGALYNSEGANLHYTSTFGGTSSASPIVTSAVALVQGAYRDRTGMPLSPAAMRQALRATAAAQGGNTSQNIGPLPNVLAAVTLLVPPVCAGDANRDQLVNGEDLSILLSTFSQTVSPGSGADFNSDGVVNFADLSVLLSRFGQPCQ